MNNNKNIGMNNDYTRGAVNNYINGCIGVCIGNHTVWSSI